MAVGPTAAAPSVYPRFASARSSSRRRRRKRRRKRPSPGPRPRRPQSARRSNAANGPTSPFGGAMPFTAVCPYCNKGQIRAPDDAIGRSATCPKCDNSFTLAPSTSLPPAPAARAKLPIAPPPPISAPTPLPPPTAITDRPAPIEPDLIVGTFSYDPTPLPLASKRRSVAVATPPAHESGRLPIGLISV